MNKLKKTLEILKEKFVGLDSTIDQLGTMITPWLMTPDILERPTIISLWGMTGTGKSSLVRALIQELGLENDTMFFDCGECTSDDRDIVGNICDTFGLGDISQDGLAEEPMRLDHPILVFDEFQYAKTIDEDGSEVIKSSIRPIWYMLDSGIIDITDSYSWRAGRTKSAMRRFLTYASLFPDAQIVKGQLGKDDHRVYLRTIGEYAANEEEDGPTRDTYVLGSEELNTIAITMNEEAEGSGIDFINKYYDTTMTARELGQIFSGIIGNMCKPRKLDLSNALVFVIGNLDEAYGVEGDINPDLDADVFYDITSKVGLSDIKMALQRRFRAEQIARLGNNMILYPTLGSKDFKKIIKKELRGLVERFSKRWPGTVKITKGVEDLIYAEGVFPVQGVRPVFTTIGAMFTPLFSKIILEYPDAKEVEISVVETDFKVDKVSIILSVDGIAQSPITQNLQLGELRNPKHRRKRYIASVHEMGHAVLFAYLTGQVPDRIVSVSTDKGGFCSTYNKEEEGEIPSRRNIDNNYQVSLGGYLAEELMYGDRLDMCLLGAHSDLSSGWEEFSSAIYSIGYFRPIRFVCSVGNSGSLPDMVPMGISPSSKVNYYDGTRFTGEILTLGEAIEKRHEDLLRQSKTVLRENLELIKKGALLLGEKGSIGEAEFLELIKENSGSLTEERLRQAKDLCSTSYYLEALKPL